MSLEKTPAEDAELELKELEKDYYSNYLEIYERRQKFKEEKRRHATTAFDKFVKAIPEKSTLTSINKKKTKKAAGAPGDVVTLSSSDDDSELDIKADDDYGIFEEMRKKARKQTEQKEKKKHAELESLLEIDDEFESDKFFPIRSLDETDDAILNFKRARRKLAAVEKHAVDSPSSSFLTKESRNGRVARHSSHSEDNDVVVLHGNDVIREASRHSASYPKRSRLDGAKISLILKDLKHGGSELRSFDYNAPVVSIVAEFSKKWRCPIAQVLLSINNEVTSDTSLSPSQLGLAVNVAYTVSVMYLDAPEPAPLSTATTENQQEDESVPQGHIRLRFQLANSRPVPFIMHKNDEFGLRSVAVASCLKIGCISRFVYDSVDIKLGETPEMLDMEDDDCIDVYPG